MIDNPVAEFVETQSCAQQQFALEQAQSFLGVSSFIGNVSVRPRGDAKGVATDARIKSDVDLVIV